MTTNKEEQKQWNILLFMLHMIAGTILTGAWLAMAIINFKYGSGDVPWFMWVATIYLDLQAIRYHLAIKQDRQDSINEQTNTQNTAPSSLRD